MYHTAAIPWARLYWRDDIAEYAVLEAIQGLYLPSKLKGNAINCCSPTPDNREWVRVCTSEQAAWEFIEQWRLKENTP